MNKEFNREKQLLAVMLLCGATLLTGCGTVIEDDIDAWNDGDPNLSVRFDWSQAASARPASMALAVFADGAQPVQTAFSGRDGGRLAISSGTYRLISFNDDTESLFSRGSSWSSFEIYSQVTSLSEATRYTRIFQNTRSIPVARGTEDEPVIFEPDELWTSSLAESSVGSDFLTTVVMPMRPTISTYSFTVRHVENLEYAVEVVASLSGMSGSWLPAAHVPSDTHCIIPFMFHEQNGTLEGTVSTFGHCPGEGDSHAKHLLTIYAEMKDGSKVFFTTDVTNAMHDANHLNPTDGGTGNTIVPIVIDTLPLPTPVTEGSGMQPSVVEWQEINVVVPMN